MTDKQDENVGKPDKPLRYKVDENGKRIGEGNPYYRPEFAAQAAELCRLGATDWELAEHFNVSRITIQLWRNVHEEFGAAVKCGKDEADERVARSLYGRAVGETIDVEQLFQFQGNIIRATRKEHVLPDPSAAISWLKNRRKKEWADTQNVNLTGEIHVNRIILEDGGQSTDG